MKRLFLIFLAGLSACASYHPLPLGDGQAVLSRPDFTGLSAQAGAVDRPWLKPVTIDLGAPLDGNAVATIAVLANPDLRAARVRSGVSDAQAFAARLLPDPTLSLSVGKVAAGSDPFLDLASALGLNLNALRTRGVQVAQARAAAQQVRLDLAWSEWQTAGNARIQAIRIQNLQRAALFAEASRTSARSLFERTQHAAGRGDLAGDQLQTARLAAADAEAKARTAESDLAVARLELLRLIGVPPETQLRLAAEPQTDLPLDTARLYALATRNRTDIRALEAGYASQEAAVHKAVLDQFPNLGLTVNTARDTAGNLILGPSVDFTLPLWNRNRGGIAIERATREALKTEYEARLFQTRAEIAAAISGIEVARRQRDTVRRDLPSAQTFASASRRAADRGDIALSTAESAEQSLRDKQVLLAQSEQAIAEQMIALELLTGTLREAWTQ